MSPDQYIRDWNQRMERIEKMLAKHNQDLYEGDGPAIPVSLLDYFALRTH